jgi:hypothetical protein
MPYVRWYGESRWLVMEADLQAPGLSVDEIQHAAGVGNWRRLAESGVALDQVYASAADWAPALSGIAKPWLCWSVDQDWCLIQQRLVKSVGWTPIVGYDPRSSSPPLEPGAILVDFNKRLNLPTMYMHFPLDLVHLFCDRLAFWHSDLLLRQEKMRALADKFAALPDGSMAAVQPAEGIRIRLSRGQRRYWEVVGCTTRGASRNAFENGCGWWQGWAYHPSTSEPERLQRSKYYWDHGSGIRYWHRHCGGSVQLVPESYIAEGHFTGISRADYRRVSPKNFRKDLTKELSLNNELVECCRKLGLDDLGPSRSADVPVLTQAT